jgi:RNA polymerase sigma-70 factor (ECF subfamily)
LSQHLGQSADVDDLVQDVMAVVIQELASFRHSGRPGAFRTWLRRIAVNRLREFWRQRRLAPAAGGSDLQRKLDELQDDHSRLTQQWDREHDRHLVQRLLERIASDFQPTTWRAFRAFVLEGKTAAAVAADLGISEGAVWTAKSHVLKRLRQMARDLLD